MLMGRPKLLSPLDVEQVHAIAAKGYSTTSIAALFDVSPAVIYATLKESADRTLPVLPARRPSFQLNWSQRVIWAS